MAKRVGIIGVGGRMGGALLRAIAESSDLSLASALDRSGSTVVGQDAGTLIGGAPSGVFVGHDLDRALVGLDVAIDFSRADSTAAHAAACARARVPLLIGTTGLDDAVMGLIDQATTRIPILVAANTSLALNVLLELVRQAAAALPAEFDIEILEAHHRHKVDAPSGTALVLADAAAAGRGDGSERRSGDRSGARQAGDIGFSVVRGGDVIGEHEVRFLGSGEQLRLGHVATDRALFARGALAAARWLSGQSPGRYHMSDFLFTKQ
ncbi:MAG: 4-hydroxy-tetrahydrodipicolinate reductase [Pseudomonadota bacterium]